jgi:putative Mn2+ efflux pump MntP
MTLETGILLFILASVLMLMGAFVTFVSRYYNNGFGIGFGYMVQALAIFMLSGLTFCAGHYYASVEHVQPGNINIGRYFGGVILALLGCVTVRQAFVSLRIPPNRRPDDSTRDDNSHDK